MRSSTIPEVVTGPKDPLLSHGQVMFPHPQGSERTFSRSTRRAGQVLGLSPLFHHHRKPGSWGSMLYSQLQSSELSSRPSLGPQ